MPPSCISWSSGAQSPSTFRSGMAWIRTIEPAAATGALRGAYDEAIDRAGRVFNVVKIMGLNVGHLRGSMDLYLSLMHGRSGLSRARREMLAVVVSVANRCHY